MKRLITVLLILLPTMLAAEAKPDAKVLDRWVGGKWVGEGAFVDSPYTKATKANGVTTCAWSPAHNFLVCDQNINFGGTPIRALAVYSFNPATGKFKFAQINLAGDPPSTTELEIDSTGDRWVYLSSGQAEKKLQFRTTNQFHGNDQVEWWSEVSADDGKTWTKTGSGKESRQK